MTEATITTTIWVTSSEVDKVKEIAEANDLQVKEASISGIGPLLLIPLIITGTIGAVGLVEHEIQVHRGGQVIDLTGAAPKFYRSKDLLYGLVVVLKKDGSITVAVKQPRDLIGAVLGAIQGILTDVGKETVDQAASAIKAAVGERATVTCSKLASNNGS